VAVCIRVEERSLHPAIPEFDSGSTQRSRKTACTVANQQVVADIVT
jgi:hypothetical protein